MGWSVVRWAGGGGKHRWGIVTVVCSGKYNRYVSDMRRIPTVTYAGREGVVNVPYREPVGRRQEIP